MLKYKAAKISASVAIDFAIARSGPRWVCHSALIGCPMAVCSSFLGEGLLLRRESDGTLVTHADLRRLSDGVRNEIVVDGRGDTRTNGGPGIIALIGPDGTARQVADGIAFPNGMAVTPDNSTLIIAESHGKKLTAFNIASDGR